MTGNLESLEKVFFSYILENPNYVQRVEPTYFKDIHIQFVYKQIREHYLSLKTKIVPSNPKIVQLVRLEDPTKKVSDDYLKALLTQDISEYEQGGDDDWLRKKVQSWCVSNSIKDRMSQAADELRNLDPTDYTKVEEIGSKIREMMGSATLLDFDDDELALDFDDPESHVQDTKTNKIPTGWNTMDELLNGGWDKKTLNIIIGPSNSGKSLWLSNIAVNTANHGKNVLYVSLEMSDKKIMKRLGAIRLRVNINEYDTKSKDKKFIQEKIKELKYRNAEATNSGDLFENPQGKMFVREFPAGSATVADLDALVKNLEEKKGIKLDMVVVDYLTIMSPDDRKGTLFTNGKQLSEGLRAIGQKHDICMVTAMQVAKENFGAGEIGLTDISESKAIVETADTMFGIIRTDNMRRENKYILKLLKLRDGGFTFEKAHFELNTQFLSIENDKRMD